MNLEYREDFLRKKPAVEPTRIDLGETNKLLMALLAETRKSVAKQRCVIDVQGGTVVGGVHTVATGLPPVGIRFINEGNPVKSLYTIIVNGSDARMTITINEPNISIGATILGNGIGIQSANAGSAINHIVLQDVEIQSLSINSSSANPIPINGPPNANGAIWVYGWTLPEYANITE